jgi:carbonic anhydrase
VYFNYNPIYNANLNWSSDLRILKLQQGSSPLPNYGYLGFSRGGILKQYALTGIEINSPSEHSINGVYGDAEIRLIHDKVLPFQSNVNQYRKIPDANTHLVISIIYKATANNTDDGLMNLLTSTYAGGAYNFNWGNSQTVNLQNFRIYEDRQFYFYEGSYTAEPCDETVNYIVLKDFFYLPPQASSVLANAYSKYKNNISSKALSQPNGRTVYRNYLNSTETISGTSIKFNLLFCAIFIALLF